MSTAESDQHQLEAGVDPVNDTPAGGTATPSSQTADNNNSSAAFYALMVGSLEAYLSTLNAVQQEAWNLRSFEDWIFAISSVLEVVGLVIGLYRLVRYKNSGLLGNPLIVLTTGVLNGDDEARNRGIAGISLQSVVSLFVFAVFTAVRFWWRIGLVLFYATVLFYIIHGERYDNSNNSGILGLSPESHNVMKVAAVGLSLAPVAIDVLESALLLNSFSVDTLLLAMVDMLMVLPAMLWAICDRHAPSLWTVFSFVFCTRYF